MQVSDYIAKFLKEIGVKKIFAVTGGASLHLIHSAQKQKGLQLVFPISEQTCAMAAEMHYRVTGNIGAAFATSCDKAIEDEKITSQSPPAQRFDPPHS